MSALNTAEANTPKPFSQTP
ncbi:hypothetical protein D039_0759A, partial [Vibrio parahaemolyticus EKP-028]